MKFIRGLGACVVLALVGVGATVVATAAPAVAKGPPPVSVTISLNCPSGTYSNLTNIALYDKSGNQLVPSGLAALECGLSGIGTFFGYGQSHTFTSPAKPASYCFSQWYWEAPSGIGASITGLCSPGANPLPHGGKPVPATSVGGPVGLTFSVG
jgi:hypothetical protein